MSCAGTVQSACSLQHAVDPRLGGPADYQAARKLTILKVTSTILAAPQADGFTINVCDLRGSARPSLSFSPRRHLRDRLGGTAGNAARRARFAFRRRRRRARSHRARCRRPPRARPSEGSIRSLRRRRVADDHPVHERARARRSRCPAGHERQHVRPAHRRCPQRCRAVPLRADESLGRVLRARVQSLSPHHHALDEHSGRHQERSCRDQAVGRHRHLRCRARARCR